MIFGSNNFSDFPLGNFSKVAFLDICEFVRSSKRWPKWHNGKYAYGVIYHKRIAPPRAQSIFRLSCGKLIEILIPCKKDQPVRRLHKQRELIRVFMVLGSRHRCIAVIVEEGDHCPPN